MPFLPRRVFEWRLRTRTLTLGYRTLLMAIVNLTPDSFSGDGLSAATVDQRVTVALDKLSQGADILDLGAESTRPGAQPVTADEEQARLLPVLEAIHAARPDVVLSVDTYHASTARAAAVAGAEIVNDVSGLLWDDAMAAAVSETGCGLVLMHTRGKPADWATLPPLASGEVAPLVLEGLRERLAFAAAAGIAGEKIVLDPGFGFGKIGAANFALLAGLAELRQLEQPLLIGLSRKGFLARQQDARLAATLAANTAAVLEGAHILRVHDVAEHHHAVAVADALLSS